MSRRRGDSASVHQGEHRERRPGRRGGRERRRQPAPPPVRASPANCSAGVVLVGWFMMPAGRQRRVAANRTASSPATLSFRRRRDAPACAARCSPRVRPGVTRSNGASACLRTTIRAPRRYVPSPAWCRSEIRRFRRRNLIWCRRMRLGGDGPAAAACPRRLASHRRRRRRYRRRRVRDGLRRPRPFDQSPA